MTPRSMKIAGLVLAIAAIFIFGLLGPALQKARRSGPTRDVSEEVKDEFYRHQEQITEHNWRVLVISASVSAFLFGSGIAFTIAGFTCRAVPRTQEAGRQGDTASC